MSAAPAPTCCSNLFASASQSEESLGGVRELRMRGLFYTVDETECKANLIETKLGVLFSNHLVYKMNPMVLEE